MSTYIINQRITNLSEKIALFADKRNEESINSEIKIDDLKNNVSYLISRALLVLDIGNSTTKSDFETIIQEYNLSNSTQLNISWYLNRHWVRIINNRLEIPYVLYRTIRNNSRQSYPQEYLHELNCLEKLYECFLKRVPFFGKNDLKNAITDKGIEDLLYREIIRTNEYGYEIAGGDYFRHLSKEIWSAVWILLLEDVSFKDDQSRFMRFVELIKASDAFPLDLDTYLDYEKLQKLSIEGYRFLLIEDDLINNGTELEKSWLDSPMYAHRQITDPIPSSNLSGMSSLDLWTIMEELTNRYQGTFEHEGSRILYDLSLRFIIEYDRAGEPSTKFRPLKRILQDSSRPYLVYESLQIMKRSFQNIIPYLLFENDLSPILFRLIREIELKNIVLSSDESNLRTEHQTAMLSKKKQVSEFWMEGFEIVLYKLSLQGNIDDSQIIMLFEILNDQVNEVYKTPNNYSQGIHLEEKRLWEHTIEKLSRIRYNHIFNGQIRARIFPSVLARLFHLLNERDVVAVTEFRALDIPGIEFALELLKLSKKTILPGEVLPSQQSEFDNLDDNISQYLFKRLSNFFTIQNIKVRNYQNGGSIIRQPNLGVNIFGFDIVEWGMLYRQLNSKNLFSKLHSEILSAMKIDETKDQYDEDIVNTREAIRYYVKSLSLAIIQINTDDSIIQKDNQLKELISDMFDEIEAMVLKHCFYDIPKGRLDIVDEGYSLSNNLYYEPLIQVIFKAWNYADSERIVSFLKKFIKQGKNLFQFLTIINLIDNLEIRKLLSKEISKLNVDNYISSTYSDSWQRAMIEAINSDGFHDIAVQLAEKLQAHTNLFQNENLENLLFEVRLWHTFKAKDFKALCELEPPKDRYGNSKRYGNLQKRKQFITGLYRVYLNKEYSVGVEIFQQLYSEQPSSPEYAYRLFHARTKLAEELDDSVSLEAAYSDWINFQKSASEETKQKIEEMNNNVLSTMIYHFSYREEYGELQKAMSILPPLFLYYEDEIGVIFKSYQKQKRNDLAMDYLANAREYHVNMELEVPSIISKLMNSIEDNAMINRLKIAFKDIRNLTPQKIVKAVPDIINDKDELDDFVLLELIQAGKTMIEKITALNQIYWENKFNDLLMAVLKLRFGIWGWDISDQGRVGVSQSSGDDLGSSDFLLSAGGNNFALIEAMILEGGNEPKTREHVIKCFDYLENTTLFYVVTYFKGTHFDRSWTSYQKNVLGIDYKDSTALLQDEFDDLSESYDVRNIKVGRTMHQDNIRMYHVFLNISSSTSI